ncbi:hypothetical protein TNCV_3875151 [Trichonephila clavipes]|nr:hypothetical protein TNCV_3875151 [Trichonephila clavipes]
MASSVAGKFSKQQSKARKSLKGDSCEPPISLCMFSVKISNKWSENRRVFFESEQFGLKNISDPSSIEHVLNMMRRRLHLPENVDELARQLKKIWQEIPQVTIRVLYHSMSRRVTAYIQARGGSTSY